MNTKIIFEKDDKKYTLEYDRKSIATMEQIGFNINEFATKPMTMLPLAFKGLFIKNHKFVKINLNLNTQTLKYKLFFSF